MSRKTGTAVGAAEVTPKHGFKNYFDLVFLQIAPEFVFIQMTDTPRSSAACVCRAALNLSPRAVKAQDFYFGYSRFSLGVDLTLTLS